MKKFSCEDNGYSKEEVNQFINEILNKTEEVIKKNNEQEKQIEQLRTELQHYKKLQDSIKEAVVQEESEKIIIDAKLDASSIINDALERAEQIERERRLLENNMRIFKKKLKLIVEQQHVIVDKIDELEIEDK